ncbi:hypothetical protein D3C73_1372300 [compost metagenome]
MAADRHFRLPDVQERGKHFLHLELDAVRRPIVPEHILQGHDLLNDQPLDMRIEQKMLVNFDFARFDSVFEIMGGIGDIVAQIHELGFKRLLPPGKPP